MIYILGLSLVGLPVAIAVYCAFILRRSRVLRNRLDAAMEELLSRIRDRHDIVSNVDRSTENLPRVAHASRRLCEESGTLADSIREVPPSRSGRDARFRQLIEDLADHEYQVSVGIRELQEQLNATLAKSTPLVDSAIDLT
ncbi:MAG: hypothetical protein AAGA03_17455, partial [Planctomycetota bacterium]